MLLHLACAFEVITLSNERAFALFHHVSSLFLQFRHILKIDQKVHKVFTISFERPVRLQLHGAIYRSDSFILMLCYCANLKAIRYESTSLKRIVADKSHRVIVALTTSATHGTFSRPSTKRGLILIVLELNTNARESFEHC